MHNILMAWHSPCFCGLCVFHVHSLACTHVIYILISGHGTAWPLRLITAAFCMLSQQYSQLNSPARSGALTICMHACVLCQSPQVSTSPLPLDRPALIEKMTRMIDFYFGEENFSKDRFLRTKARETPEGWIPVPLILSFKRVRKCVRALPPPPFAIALAFSVTGFYTPPRHHRL
jgi:hypothetical protein